MKRDSKQSEVFREKPFGARLYLRIVEPVLELCTDRKEGYTGSAHYSVRVFNEIKMTYSRSEHLLRRT
mgnify:CR=1 FL=1